MKYKYFEGLTVWQDTRQFVSFIYKLLTRKKFKNDYHFMDQIRRANLSITLNITEGFKRKANKEFSRFINIAKSYSGECRAAFYIAFDVGYFNKDEPEKSLQKV